MTAVGAVRFYLGRRPTLAPKSVRYCCVRFGRGGEIFEGVIEAGPEDAACLEGVFVVLAETENVEGTFALMADDFSVAD
jgi:hypothetical protein